MARYIDVGKIDYSFIKDVSTKLTLKRLIICQPTADVVEVKRGKWRKAQELSPRYVCTCCSHLYNNMGYKYCPNCGAKMDGDLNDL